MGLNTTIWGAGPNTSSAKRSDATNLPPAKGLRAWQGSEATEGRWAAVPSASNAARMIPRLRAAREAELERGITEEGRPPGWASPRGGLSPSVRLARTGSGEPAPEELAQILHAYLGADEGRGAG